MTPAACLVVTEPRADFGFDTAAEAAALLSDLAPAFADLALGGCALAVHLPGARLFGIRRTESDTREVCMTSGAASPFAATAAGRPDILAHWRRPDERRHPC